MDKENNFMALTSALRSFDRDKDSLHMLPLSMIPLRSQALRDTRLVKNARLEGVVEMFSDPSSGSGQVAPEDLPQVFDLSGDRIKDLDVVKALSLLPSYDVYSLQMVLQDLHIEVVDPDGLSLSGEMQQTLSPALKGLTRPLVATIYGEQRSETVAWADAVRDSADPSVETVHCNLRKLSSALRLDMSRMPQFLADFGDLCLSLAYYQHFADLNAASMSAFLESVADVRGDRLFRSNRPFQRTCNLVANRLTRLHEAVARVLKAFRHRIEEWARLPSFGQFRDIQEQVIGYRSRIGGALCAVAVKLSAWDSRFLRWKATTPLQQAEFLVGVMQQGLDRIEVPKPASA